MVPSDILCIFIAQFLDFLFGIVQGLVTALIQSTV